MTTSTHTPCLAVTKSTNVTSEHHQRRKSVRFSRFEKVYYTHSPFDYDRTSILAELALNKRQIQIPIQPHHIHHHQYHQSHHPHHPRSVAQHAVLG